MALLTGCRLHGNMGLEEIANEFGLLKVKFNLWWLWLVVKKLLHLLSNSVLLMFLEFIQTKVIPYLDIQ
jgi:hypothetical protein